jgi:hypothetical protein
MKKVIHFISCIVIVFILIFVSTTSSKQFINKGNKQIQLIDYDPFIDINITVDIQAIRALDKIDPFSKADFFVKMFINDVEFTSPVWNNTDYLYNCYTVTTDVPDDKKTVDVTIQLWDADGDDNKQCDISKDPNINGLGLDIQLTYDISIGRWSGDNNNADVTGYGRVSGSADGSIYKDENDCELWFSIHQNDFDNDGLPYWVETNVYGTDPTKNDIGSDADADGIPIEWEHRYGFNPFVWDDHENIDPDRDSINNIEEYKTYNFGSDPFRKDVFLEIDYMQESNGEIRNVSQEALELVQTPFHRRNIVFHFDTGQLNGGEIVPYDADCNFEEIRAIWNNYFLHNNSNDWRRGVFHYVIFVHDQTPKGYGFSGDVAPYWGYNPGTDAFAIANTLVEKKAKLPFKSTEYITASLIIHEMGHNFGIRFGEPFGCDNRLTGSPFKLGWYIWGNYKSIMNYRYTYSILDYSDGSHGKIDYDDWENIDLTYFEKPG